MQVIQNLKGFCIALLSSLDCFCFRKPVALWFSCARQVAFSGRTWSDAAQPDFRCTACNPNSPVFPPEMGTEPVARLALAQFLATSDLGYLWQPKGVVRRSQQPGPSGAPKPLPKRL